MPIAVIGMACRFPGDATSPEKLWELCANARSAWSPIPSNRFNQAAWYHPDKEHLGTVFHLSTSIYIHSGFNKWSNECLFWFFYSRT